MIEFEWRVLEITRWKVWLFVPNESLVSTYIVCPLIMSWTLRLLMTLLDDRLRHSALFASVCGCSYSRFLLIEVLRLLAKHFAWRSRYRRGSCIRLLSSYSTWVCVHHERCWYRIEGWRKAYFCLAQLPQTCLAYFWPLLHHSRFIVEALHVPELGLSRVHFPLIDISCEGLHCFVYVLATGTIV